MLTIACLSIDATDPAALARFWADLLDWWTGATDDGDHWVRDPAGAAAAAMPGLLFLPSSDPRPGKNRLHLDLSPADREAEVERALALGATRVDIGQSGAEPWVVLADPEGNEFCILDAGTWP